MEGLPLTVADGLVDRPGEGIPRFEAAVTKIGPFGIWDRCIDIGREWIRGAEAEEASQREERNWLHFAVGWEEKEHKLEVFGCLMKGLKKIQVSEWMIFGRWLRYEIKL